MGSILCTLATGLPAIPQSFIEGRGKSKDKCTFTLNIRANAVTKASQRKSTKAGHGKAGGGKRKEIRSSMDLSTRDLYCIQTIFDQEDVFKLLVGCLRLYYSI